MWELQSTNGEVAQQVEQRKVVSAQRKVAGRRFEPFPPHTLWMYVKK
jgi:hypothetical protein